MTIVRELNVMYLINYRNNVQREKYENNNVESNKEISWFIIYLLFCIDV